jgi:branched-chain amino acid transport system substrate-binding protein
MMKNKWLIISAIILFVLAWMAYNSYFYRYRNTIHIAFVGPMSGDGKKAGELMTQGIQLHFDHINQRGGVNGKYLELDIFDDQNDSKLARQRALEIVKQDRALAVIGHWYSSASISGGKVYKEYKIPAITPGSASIEVTQGNEWYFRNIYNDSASGQFLANYIKHVFQQNKVTIIHEQEKYGSYLAKVFQEQVNKLNMKVKNLWRYDNYDSKLEATFQKIVKELNAVKNDAGIIFLAVQAAEGIKLVKLIRDAGIENIIVGASSLSEESFRNGFNQFPIERENPGIYTNNIYVATPLIFDTANEKAQQFLERYVTLYKDNPDWSAAYAYDTALVLTELIKKTGITGVHSALKDEREKLRSALAKLTNIYEAVEGVTGFNYFDSNRDALKPVSLGVYKQKQLISALTQLQILRNVKEISDLKRAIQENRIILVNDQHMYKTNVVYIGMNVNEISGIDTKKLIYEMELKLWIRFQGEFNPENIEFINAIDPKAIQEQFKQPLEEKIQDKIVYRVYRIRGKFRADFLPSYHVYKKHLVGLSFRHHELTRNNLIYVTDVLGMGLLKEKSLAARLMKSHVLNPAEGWIIDRVWFFPDIIKEYSSGDPDYLNAPDGMVEYSRFNAAIQIKKDQLTLRGLIPYEYAFNIMVISGLTFLVLFFSGQRKQNLAKLLTWLLQVVFAFLCLLSGEILFAEWLAENTDAYQMKYIVKVFDILWWVLPAFLVHIALERFVWAPLEEQVGNLPNIIRHFFALLIYGLAAIGITVFVYEQQFNSLLATSGMVAMIVGLAIKINIANVFSGIVINIERPFRIGDWVQIGTFDEGEVMDINWRATRLKRRDGCMLSIPNSIASESIIINFYYPDKVYWLWPTVYVHPQYSPKLIKKLLLDALLSTEKILHKPEPVVIFTGINEWAAGYWVAFCADNYADKYMILEEVWTRVWFHLSRANITSAVMRQEIHLFKGNIDSNLNSSSDPTPPPFVNRAGEKTKPNHPLPSLPLNMVHQG